MEELIDQKNQRIAQLENGQEGYVMVEEDLLHHVETSFANFQGSIKLAISLTIFKIILVFQSELF